jgi:hypothetical protein
VLENEEMDFSEEEEMYRKKNPQLFMSIYIILMEKRGGRERENAPCTKTMWSLYTFDQMQY